MPILELSPADQYLIATGDTPLLEVWAALPEGLYPPFPPVEQPGGLNGLLKRGGFAQTFFFASEVLGLTLLSPRSQTIQAGGKVVKNVQGYDLVRPFVGSFGALGECLQATLRLRPGRASVLLRRTGELSEVRQRPKFLWKELEYLYAFHYGHPREVERLHQSFGGEAVEGTLDYTPLFPRGMGTGNLGSVRDLRFGWENAGPPPPMPEVFKRLSEAV